MVSLFLRGFFLGNPAFSHSPKMSLLGEVLKPD